MEYEYSKSMKNLKKKKTSRIIYIAIIVLMAIMVIGSVWGYLSDKETLIAEKENVQLFNSLNTDLSYSKVIPRYLSDAFATNYDNSIHYVFAIDNDYNAYIVAIKVSAMEQYKDFIEYSYSSSGNPPAAITLEGTPRKLDNDDAKLQMTIKAFNAFLGKNIISETNFNTILGAYYLDTTQSLPGNFIFMNICIFILIVLAFIYILLIDKGRESSKLRKATLIKFGNSELEEVDIEINDTNATYFKSQNMYITTNYIVSTIRGLEIIPIAEIIQVFGSVYEKNPKTSITVVTMDGIKHNIAAIKLNKKGTALLDQIVNRIKSVLPNITYGFKDGFYIINSSSDLMNIGTDSANDFSLTNVLLGTIGAILGALLGGIIWICIGNLGFVAGLAGFAMMFFSIKGYGLFSGHLDKKGQIISLITTFIMIFLANYTLYALQYCKIFYDGNYTINTILNSFKNLSSYLFIAGSWDSFMKDLLIGYGLSIWCGFGLIKSIFSRK